MWKSEIARDTRHSKYIRAVKKSRGILFSMQSITSEVQVNEAMHDWSLASLKCLLQFFWYQLFHLDGKNHMLWKYWRSRDQIKHIGFHLGFCYDSLHCSRPGSYIYLSSNPFSNCCNTQPKKIIWYPIGQKNIENKFSGLFSNYLTMNGDSKLG